MSLIYGHASPDLLRNCLRCGGQLSPAAFECDQCHALVHAVELERLAAEAKTFEAKGQPREAIVRWQSTLSLLPPMSKQANWVRDKIRSLDALADRTQPIPQPTDNKWAQRLGPLSPIAVILAKSKVVLSAIFKLKFLLSFVAFFGFYWALFGMKFGIGLALLVLIHEMGHFFDVKRRGLPADMPVFLPGFGAYVRWRGLGVGVETRAAISLAGPLAGFLASLICAALWWQTGNSLWAALARAGAWLNLMNLIPVWVLDGGQAALALSRNERLLLLSASLLLWLVLGENIFFLLAIGAGYQVFFAGDFPPRPSSATLVYFVSVLTALGFVLRFMPGQGFGSN